ncbi:MAG: 4'-phosphopantetheinyl transferase superfamily protein [Tidjanibacter sp.]|nr:4'-phosphopantetheinyl transferase superfamily protein [Tidjanibacter sp.]
MDIDIKNNMEATILKVAAVEPTAEESALLTESDREHLATLSAPARRAQWSTCRTILRSELGEGAELRYTASGALVLARPVGEVRYISLSHTEQLVAVMLCTKRCGVDIESIDRNFSRVASRFISHDERERLESKAGPHFEAIMWSAKEALYKYGSNPGLDFIQDLIITDIDPDQQCAYAELYGLSTPVVRYQIADGHICCWVCG